ncbi:MAG: hypothetical protein EA409_11205 [Saprospirales bacterium]|nr:MAG: hypothetical protein EA409_11205 [Saprospirales bacterium]
MSPIIDIHAHPQIKPFNAELEIQLKKGLWQYFSESAGCSSLGGLRRKALESLVKDSQTNLDQAIMGDVRGLFISLYPVERNFFDVRKRHFLLRLILGEKHMRDFAACVTGFGRPKIDKIFDRYLHKKGLNYYRKELIDEYNFLVSETSDPRFVIASDYDEFISTLEQGDKVASILTIEGAHALGSYEKEDFWRPVSDADQDDIHRRLLDGFETHISASKRWNGGKHCPFFITFSHHFCNLLAGHSQSFKEGGIIPGMANLLDQRNGMDEGFSKLGWDVLKLLLSNIGERRILIDVKHMSVKARIEYFEYLKTNYWDKGEDLPIICSHSAFSGYRTLEESNKRDSNRRYNRNYLSKQSINISDEEAQIITRSRGLIGLVLHGGRLPGGLAKKQMERARNADELRDATIALIMSNIFHMLRAVDDQSAWDCISLGTDMDGIIEALPPYTNYSSLKLLPIHLRQFFHRPFDLPGIGMGKKEVKKLMYEYSPEELTDKICSKNALRFLKRYFNEDYLLRRV